MAYPEMNVYSAGPKSLDGFEHQPIVNRPYCVSHWLYFQPQKEGSTRFIDPALVNLTWYFPIAAVVTIKETS